MFGDSLSDNGNLYQYLQKSSTKVAQKRFTNGLVWVELLSKLYYPNTSQQHLIDYAFGGAEALDSTGDNENAFTLSHEIDTYLLTHQGKSDSNTLYIIWIGANNYLSLPEDIKTTVSDVNNSMLRDIKRLVDSGATYIMLVNQPDLGKIPAAVDLDAVALLSELSVAHNLCLQSNRLQLEQDYPAVTWIFLDVYALFNQMLNAPKQFGLLNTVDSCVDGMSTVSKRSCKGYLFFDPIHPSELAHIEMAKKTKAMLDEAHIRFA